MLFHHDTRVRHSSIAYSETELMTVNKGLPSLLVYRGSQTIRAFKLWYVTADCSSVTLHTLVR